MEESLLVEYAELKANMKALEAKEVELKAKIIDGMHKESREKVPSVFGDFELRKRKTWAYPANVKRIEEDLKVAKYEAEEKGTASFTESESLYFIATKI